MYLLPDSSPDSEAKRKWRGEGRREILTELTLVGCPALHRPFLCAPACAKKDALLPKVSCALAGKLLWAAQPTWKYGLGSTFTRTLLIFVEFCT